jgi:hypothetical protein
VFKTLKKFFSWSFAYKKKKTVMSKHKTHLEMTKLYRYLIEESRNLPIITDYNENSVKKAAKSATNSTIYAYCHKSVLPIDQNIIEEQSRARKWISDIFLKRTSSNNFFIDYNIRNLQKK